MKGKFKVEGFKELDKALGEFTKRTSKAVLKRALVKAAKPMLAEAIQLAPVRYGTLKRSLIISTKVDQSAFRAAFGKVKYAGGSVGEARAAGRRAQRGRKGANFAEVSMGPGRNPQSGMQEFGTVTNPPQPYMRPAWDSNKRGALDIFRDELAAEIAKTARRAAAKAAKLRAKG